jgi:type II secretory pathway pseudopilin PulG
MTRKPLPTSRAALTLLEVVLALTTLVIAASALLGGSSFAANLGARDQRRLEATEVAHRLILQHMEDPDFFKGEVKRTEINGRYYAFSLDEDVVSTDDASTGGSAGGSRTKYRANPLATTVGDMERLKQANRLTVRVYPDDDNTGIGQKIALAELTRYYVWIGGVIDEDDVMRETLRRVGKGLDQSGLGNTTGK